MQWHKIMVDLTSTRHNLAHREAVVMERVYAIQVSV
jgi:hypothetical protein